jgi:hypothetical protein
VTLKENFMKRLTIILLTTFLLLSCTRVEFDLNPWTTVMKGIVKNGQN